MSDLVKATLKELGDPPKPAVDVQFNPASLKLALSNVVEGGRAQGRQVRQFLGSSSTEVSFELVFDSADDGRNVRERTALVEKFLVPKRTGASKATPPKVRFQWASYVIDGVISGLSIDIDLFAADGTPLRAKMGVSIKEQDPKYQYLQAGSGANRPDGAVVPGARGDARPGTSGDFLLQTEAALPSERPPNRTHAAVAIEGESAADFATRVGLDPTAWRAVAHQVEGSTLSLPAGQEIEYDPSASAQAGLGAGAAIEAGADASLEASFGLAAGGGGGFALTVAGGLSAALEAVQIARATAAEASARQAFAPPTAAVTPTVAKPTPPDQPRRPLRRDDRPPTLATRGQSEPVPPPPVADARSISFGFGVPLRPRISDAAGKRRAAVRGAIALRPREQLSDVPTVRDPGAPPWTALPTDESALIARARGGRARGPHHCGCGGACGHKGAHR